MPVFPTAPLGFKKSGPRPQFPGAIRIAPLCADEGRVVLNQTIRYVQVSGSWNVSFDVAFIEHGESDDGITRWIPDRRGVRRRRDEALLDDVAVLVYLHGRAELAPAEIVPA